VDAMIATNEDEKVVHEFSKKEMELLKLFMEFEGRVLSRDLMLDRIWGEDGIPQVEPLIILSLPFARFLRRIRKTPFTFNR
jgi:DNA-binding response OmpR family regulator